MPTPSLGRDGSVPRDRQATALELTATVTGCGAGLRLGQLYGGVVPRRR